MATPNHTRSNLFSTPSSSSTTKSHHHHSYKHTPSTKTRRLHYPAMASSDHPVEVIGRIRDHPIENTKQNKPNNPTLPFPPHPIPPSALQINPDRKSLRLKTEIGYRDFTLDGVSLSEDEDLDGFYKKFIESRVDGVKLGQKCTIMMYGPTGSGKSHTMFGCLKQPGIVYHSLKAILGDEGLDDDGEEGGGMEKLVGGFGTFVQVTVLEVYNEEIYDLLSTTNSNVGGGGGGFKGGSASKVRLEVMGKKAKNATFISGNEAGKILKEIQKVEKRRIVKSTLCNERSSRSHCMIIVDVPTVGGRLMLVDMAGSENIEQAGQNGFEAKMQTGKINQGNIALKRVVESIANGDSHVPFRDSKLTMLLQDSFEDDKSKILMILCASPDQKELHKTIATLEYGAKAKCIVRGPHTPIKDKGTEDSSAVILGSRIEALDQFICKLQTENKIKEKERNEAQKELKRKEEEVSLLRSKLAVVEMKPSEEEINSKVNERTLTLRKELEMKIQECQRMANECVEMERRRMEEIMFQQQQEVEMLRRRLGEIESQLRLSQTGSGGASVDISMQGSSFMKRLLEVCNEDLNMVRSMDLDKSIDMETSNNTISCYNYNGGVDKSPNKACLLTTVHEEEEYENEEDDKENNNVLDEVVEKEVIEEKKMIVAPPQAASSREMRIQNIFTLCGNYRELSQHNTTPMPARNSSDREDSAHMAKHFKESHKPLFEKESLDDLEVYVKWEASKDNPGKFITTLKVLKDSTLADLRKLIEIHLGGDQEAFTFLALEDFSGAPVPKEKEATTKTEMLPNCNSQLRGHLACLRPVKPLIQGSGHLPFSPLENKMVSMMTPNSHIIKQVDNDGRFSPETPEHLSSTPFITIRRY